MEIRTFDTVYTIIHKTVSESGMFLYLCRNQMDGMQYLLFGRKRQCISKENIAFLNEQLNNKEFTDFQDLFVYEDQLIAAMRYHVAPTLLERLKEETEFEERLEIGRGILEAFLVQKMPAYFQLQCLNLERVLISDAMEIKFAYSFDNMEAASERKQEEVWMAFASLLENMWKPELRQHNVLALKGYIEYLRTKEPKTQEEVYRAYLGMMKTIQSIPVSERNQPNSKWLRLWNRIRRQIPKLKNFIAVLLIAGALVFLGYTIWKMKQPAGTAEPVMRYIGTLELKE